MLLKIRYKKTITYEAFVELPSGESREDTLAQAMCIADTQDLWRNVEEEGWIDTGEIVAEYGRLPTVRQDKEE